MGRYAAQHGVEAAVQVYSDKLLVAVRPSTVRRFRQQYGETAGGAGTFQLSETSSTTISLLHSSMDVLNQNPGAYTQHYPAPAQTAQQPLSAPPPLAPDPLTKPEPDSKPDREGKKAGRGRYVQYTPELRAKIGRFALKHGNAAAMKHFQTELGHEIPESTVRGMRDKYQVVSEARGGAGVSAVGCGPRGRPASLGSHDRLVRDAVRRLQEKGEKITAFVVIAVAKQVILQQDPAALQEFGGAVRLNTTWAKSMLRRLGIKNKGKIDL